MISRVRNLAQFRLERALISGPWARLLVIAILIVAVSVLAGLVVFFATPGFQSLAEAIWWAFLRLSDPGYLGDDQGALRRTVSTIVTIAGYVLFMGSMIAIMTQWLMQTLRNLERGLTPIVAEHHLVILGWSNRTVAVLRELLGSEGRVRRFLRFRGVRRLRIAVLAEEVGPELVAELAGRLGPLWNPGQIILRSGDPLRLEHLRRVDFAHAAAILLPGREQGSGEPVDADTEAIKTLASIASAVDDASRAPLVVAEIHDVRESVVAGRLYPGPVEIVASGQLIGRLVAQTLRHPGLSQVYNELLRHDEDNELYLRPVEGLAGARLGQLFDAFPRAIPLGVIRADGDRLVSHLGLSPGSTLRPDDRLVLVARSYEEAAPGGTAGAEVAASEDRGALARGERPLRRVLLLGWNQRCPALLGELEGSVDQRFAVTVSSMIPAAGRISDLEAQDVRPRRTTVEHVELDATNLSHVRRLQPCGFDHVVIMASERADSEAASDARTILSSLLLDEIVAEGQTQPEVLVELVDPENAGLFASRASEVIVSPLIVSHMLAQVALRPELRLVFDDLFGAGGAEIAFCPPAELGLAGPVTFRAIQAAANARGMIGLGAKLSGAGLPHGGVTLNPTRDREIELAPDDRVVVLADA